MGVLNTVVHVYRIFEPWMLVTVVVKRALLTAAAAGEFGEKCMHRMFE